MRAYPNDQMVRYTHDWVLFDEENGWVVFAARTHMADLCDGRSYSMTNWTRIHYAGKGQFAREGNEEWQAAKDALLLGGEGGEDQTSYPSDLGEPQKPPATRHLLNRSIVDCTDPPLLQRSVSEAIST